MKNIGGIYHALFIAGSEFKARIGAQGEYLFAKGCYVYTGTAQKGLLARIERHSRKEKRLFWHIDYFTSNKNVEFAGAYYLTGASASQECISNLNMILNSNFYIPKFGCSDCVSCPSHLAGFYSLAGAVKHIDAKYIKF